MANDPLMGTPLAGQPALRATIWAVLGGVLMLGVIGAGYLLFAPRSPAYAPIDNQVAPVAVPTPVASETPPPPAPIAKPPADFVITDALVARKLTADQLEPSEKAICVDQPLAIRNDTARTVTLLDTPQDSDATIELGTVKPGAVFSFSPNEEGVYVIASQAVDGWLFRYKAASCGPDHQE